MGRIHDLKRLRRFLGKQLEQKRERTVTKGIFSAFPGLSPNPNAENFLSSFCKTISVSDFGILTQVVVHEFSLPGLCDDPDLADLVDNYKAPASIFVEILVAVGYSCEKLERRDFSNHIN